MFLLEAQLFKKTRKTFLKLIKASKTIHINMFYKFYHENIKLPNSFRLAFYFSFGILVVTKRFYNDIRIICLTPKGNGSLSAGYKEGFCWFDKIWKINSRIFVYSSIFRKPEGGHKNVGLIWFGLVWFYRISTNFGYLMPNPAFTCILNIYDLQTFCWYKQLNNQTVLFLTIQFSVSQKIKWFQ